MINNILTKKRKHNFFKWLMVLCLTFYCCNEDADVVLNVSSGNLLISLQSEALSLDRKIDFKNKDTIVIALEHDFEVLEQLKNDELVLHWKISKNAQLKVNNKILKSGKSRIPFANKKNYFYQNIFVVSENGTARKYTVKIKMKDLAIPSFLFVKFSEKSIAGKNVIPKIKSLKNYEFEKFENLTPENIAQISEDTKTILFKKIGKFRVKIILKHKKSKATFSVFINFEIRKDPAENFHFTPLSKILSAGFFGETEIFKNIENIEGHKTLYQIKKLENIQPPRMAQISSNGKSLIMKGQIGNFTADIILEHPNKEDSKIQNAAFEITRNASEKLGFLKLSKLYKDKTFTSSEIFENITGKKEKYTLKEIKNIQPFNIVRISASKKSLEMFNYKTGIFTADLILEHPQKEQAIVNATFEIVKNDKEPLTFQKYIAKLGHANILETQILGNIKGNWQNYRIQEITNVMPPNMANIAADKTYLIHNNTLGTFTADLILEHPIKKNTTIPAIFEVEKQDAEILSFRPVTKTHTQAMRPITQNEIQANLLGNSSGYTLKIIITILPYDAGIPVRTNIATSNDYIGNFTATMVFEHPIKKDAQVIGRFNITKDPTPAGYRVFDGVPAVAKVGRVFNNDYTVDYLGWWPFQFKRGYRLKKMRNMSRTDFARLSEDGKTLLALRPGRFTAEVILEHPTKQDLSLTKNFVVWKANKERLFPYKIIKKQYHLRKFTENDILDALSGNKAGYRIRRMEISYADVATRDKITIDRSRKIINIKTNKTGRFYVYTYFEHPLKQDTSMTMVFEILKDAPPTDLSFHGVSEKTWGASIGSFPVSFLPYLFVKQHIRGTRSGYRITDFKDISPPLATVLYGSSGLAVLKEKNAVGEFTATIKLSHPTKRDTIIRNARFKIKKGHKRYLEFSVSPLEKMYSLTGVFSEAEIYANVAGNKTGYTIKSIQHVSDSNIAELSGKSFIIKKPGLFTAQITLEHPTREDTTILAYHPTNNRYGVGFRIKELPAEDLKWKGILKKQYRTEKESLYIKWDMDKDRDRFSVKDILGNIDGKKQGYYISDIDDIKNLIPGLRLADHHTSGIRRGRYTFLDELEILRTGKFTAKITLKHPIKESVEITGAEFEILRGPAEKLIFPKYKEVFELSGGGAITSGKIKNHILGNKQGYELSGIRNLTGLPAGLDPLSGNKILHLSGMSGLCFRADLQLKHLHKEPLEITGAEFCLQRPVSMLLGPILHNYQGAGNARGVVEDADGSFVIVGDRPYQHSLISQIHHATWFTEGFIVRIKDGKVLKDEPTAQGREIIDIIKTHDDKYVTIRKGYSIAKYDKDLSEEWSHTIDMRTKYELIVRKPYPGGEQTSTIKSLGQVIQDSEGNYVAVGSVEHKHRSGSWKTSAFVIKLDSNGDFLWQNFFEADPTEGYGIGGKKKSRANTIVELSGGHYLVGGYRERRMDCRSRKAYKHAVCWIFEVDKDTGGIRRHLPRDNRLNPIFIEPEQCYSHNYISKMIKTSDGKLIMSAKGGYTPDLSYRDNNKTWIMKTELDGTVLFKEKHDFTSPYNLVEDRDGHFIFNTLSSRNPTVVKINKANGKEIMRRRYDPPASIPLGYIGKVILTKDGGYLGVGSAGTTYSRRTPWILKTDSKGMPE